MAVPPRALQSGITTVKDSFTQMKRLLLLRHAKSSWDDPELDDFDRPLAPRGERAARLMGSHMAAKVAPPSVVLCSPARRARDTLDLVLPAVYGVPVVFERELYVFEHRPLLARLREVTEENRAVMVVGHNPALEDLTNDLAGPQSDSVAVTRLGEKYPTATLAELAFDGPWADLATGAARLAGFTRPKDLEER